MPLYEYQCEACSHRFERIQKFSDPPADACPKCGGTVRKLISSPAIQFKGSGFYITDYGKSGAGSGESKGQKADKEGAAGEKKSDSKTDSKGETKAEAKPDAKPASSAKPE
jgi:putative FmdB family regulatory protein